ncbi:hypothetical protein [Tardiphaga sp. P9-11]|uniref:hypothetical protein n=1 Tax=Tardiphaga sp. P9-11 TaxID=2024614 RepID=UPI0011F118A6|nr:hypothetical protein [Tardiphaga sp. P9-11]KAA0069534.1 hypothetical protein CIW50_28640 [Tardiphaga sp. P9-11]
MTKYVDDKRPYADPAKAADKLVEIAKTLRVDQGHMPVGEWNGTFLKGGAGTVAEYAAGRDHLIETGVIKMHECGSMFRWKIAPAAELLGTKQTP